MDAVTTQVATAETPKSALVSPQDMSREEWKAYRKDRTIPERAEKPPKQVSAPATDVDRPEPVDQAASTDASAQPDSASGEPVKKRGADSRIQELLKERALERQARRQLEERLAAIERNSQPKPDAKADPSPAPAKAPWQAYAEMPDAPKEEQFERYGDYTAAMAMFIADQRLSERDKQAEQSQRRYAEERQFAEQAQQAATKFSKFVEKNPEAVHAIRPELLAIVPISQLPQGATPGAHNFIAEQILRSDVPGELSAHFSTEEGIQDFQRLMRMGPEGILRAIGRLESRFETGAASAASPKTVSDAPEPPQVLGRRPGRPVDEEKAAIAAGDIRAYRRARNAKVIGRKG